MEMIEDTKFIDVYELGERLLTEFGLHDWTFELSNKKTFLGTCSHGKKQIVFSSYFLHIPWEDIEDTIRHEIAHALVGPSHGHDYVWQMKAIMVGARPERCAPPHLKTSAKYNYVIECPICDNKWYRYRLRRQMYGAKCPDCHVEVEIYRLEHGVD